VYCVVLIGYIFIFNIGFNLLLTFLGRTLLSLFAVNPARIHPLLIILPGNPYIRGVACTAHYG
jgi:hypothetical protein